MAYNESLYHLTTDALDTHKVAYEIKKMFGGICFLVADKMCMGIVGDELMVRFNPLLEPEVYTKKGSRPMDFTGRPMKGYAFVSQEVLKTTADFTYWIKIALDFNKIAKSSRKK